MNQSGPDSSPDLWVGLATLLPWVLIYLRGFIAEVGKASGQTLWRMLSRRLRKQQPESPVTVVIVVSRVDDPTEAD